MDQFEIGWRFKDGQDWQQDTIAVRSFAVPQIEQVVPSTVMSTYAGQRGMPQAIMLVVKDLPDSAWGVRRGELLDVFDGRTSIGMAAGVLAGTAFSCKIGSQFVVRASIIDSSAVLCELPKHIETGTFDVSLVRGTELLAVHGNGVQLTVVPAPKLVRPDEALAGSVSGG